ncbi:MULTISPECIES: hypothetical protein [unclassified Neisseria]|uniref:hypothetical protein n=1 Tax=unclassified Neisseria TaxID=2623750 RepID=UPI0026653062|nr:MULTISPECIES: hypothetical protein [unclassified Neisseria]MDO1510221.1 hypothetical protein [Neisseria sp. MVDL19-042950]MDO1516390.1 hypothetical protein [Neisseria sp. MVDL18-041461]MDO1563538.1 hypothetical protein [Neisseria sp. MVDL20-010259]
MYCIPNFGLSRFDGGLLIQTPKGFFEITNSRVCEIILSLPRSGGLIEDVEVIQLLERGEENDSQEVMSYLVETLGIIAKTNISNKSSLVMTTSSIWADVARYLDFDVIEKMEVQPGKINVMIFEGAPEERIIDAAIQELSENDQLIIGFCARSNFVISSTWFRNSGLPCPLCTVDFSLDRVFFDPHDAGMGLSDVYDFVRSLNVKEPSISLRKTDIAFLLRYVKQYIESLSGIGFGAFSPFDPLFTSVIDLAELNRQLVRIPLSPLCNCIKHQI